MYLVTAVAVFIGLHQKKLLLPLILIILGLTTSGCELLYVLGGGGGNSTSTEVTESTEYFRDEEITSDLLGKYVIAYSNKTNQYVRIIRGYVNEQNQKKGLLTVQERYDTPHYYFEATEREVDEWFE